MIRLTLCLMLSTVAFAQYYGTHESPSPIPMDFHDPLNYKDSRLPPSSNFVYNFEHTRRDQPPHVEMREENLGKYMGRPRTTTPIPVTPKLLEQQVPDFDTVHLHHLADSKPVSMKPYVPQRWNPISSHLPATIPPPPTTPRWMDLSDESFRHHTHHQPRRPMNAYEHTPTEAPRARWTPPAPSFETQPPQQETSYSNMMPQHAPAVAKHSMPSEHSARNPAFERSSSRGSHKFNWDDVAVPVTAPVVPITSAPAPAAFAPQNRGPPSIPTLAPWYGDDFGK